MRLKTAFNETIIFNHLNWRESICLGSPTLDHLAGIMNISRTYLSTLLFGMERKGVLRRDYGCERSIKLMEPAI